MTNDVRETSIELWRTVPGFPDYLVSNYGRVYSRPRRRLLKLWLNRGYYKTNLFDKTKHRKGFFVHRLVASAFIANPERKEQVNHINDNREDNRAWNLEWVTQAEHGVHSSKPQRQGLHLEVVKDIVDNKLSARQAAKKHGVHQTTANAYLKKYGYMFDENRKPPEPPILTEREIIQRAIIGASLKARLNDPRWAVVKSLLGCGSTMAKRICAKYGFDPDKTKEHFDDG